MTEKKWNQPNNNPNLPPDMKKVVSNLQALQSFLENKILEDQVSIDRLEMELKKVQAQAQAQKEQENG